MKTLRLALLAGLGLIAGFASAQPQLLMFRQQAQLEPARRAIGPARTQLAYTLLREQAARTDAEFAARAEAAGVRVLRRFQVVNAMLVEADAVALARLQADPTIQAVVADRSFRVVLPDTEAPRLAPLAVEASLNLIRVPQVWALGIYGAGVTLASQDTGVQWNHPALLPRYRGNDGISVSHAYHWHDAIHTTGSSCGADAPVPCDDNSHGTHTVGTMLGADGANQVGVAPGAQWIACRNMNAGNGTPSTYLECMDFMLAPTDAAGANPRPDLAPDIINNSWGCPPSEGCNAAANGLLQTAVDNLRAAGALFVAAAGNSGSSCSTVSDAPAFFASSLTVGNTTLADAISGSSSRGPVTIDGSGRMKPDLSAPGSGIRSTVPGNGYGTKSGTSMAAPHIAGVAALMISANPGLRRNPEAVEALLKAAVVPISSTQTCGGIAGTTWPNNTVGTGRIDAYAAVLAAAPELADRLMVNGFE